MFIGRIIPKGLRALLQPPAITNCQFYKPVKVCSGTQINDTIVHKYSYVGHDCFIINSEIGSYTSIADNCRIGGATHSMDYVSTSPVFNVGKNVLKTNFYNFDSEIIKKTFIGPDVWIGANAILISGVEIGVGSVVGAGSVVTHNIPPYEIWAGNPAKFIRYRFSETIIEALLDTKWWDWPEEKVKQYAYLFNNPEEFVRQQQELIN